MSWLHGPPVVFKHHIEDLHVLSDQSVSQGTLDTHRKISGHFDVFVFLTTVDDTPTSYDEKHQSTAAYCLMMSLSHFYGHVTNESQNGVDSFDAQSLIISFQ